MLYLRSWVFNSRGFRVWTCGGPLNEDFTIFGSIAAS